MNSSVHYENVSTVIATWLNLNMAIGNVGGHYYLWARALRIDPLVGPLWVFLVVCLVHDYSPQPALARLLQLHIHHPNELFNKTSTIHHHTHLDYNEIKHEHPCIGSVRTLDPTGSCSQWVGTCGGTLDPFPSPPHYRLDLGLPVFTWSSQVCMWEIAPSTSRIQCTHLGCCSWWWQRQWFDIDRSFTVIHDWINIDHALHCIYTYCANCFFNLATWDACRRTVISNSSLTASKDRLDISKSAIYFKTYQWEWCNFLHPYVF